jgi:hypothetical protein
MAQLLICGGSDAGLAAGPRARGVDPASTLTVLVASICGLPFCMSGETPDWRQHDQRTAEELKDAGLDYPGVERLCLRVTAGRKTGQLRVSAPRSALRRRIEWGWKSCADAQGAG